MQWGSLHRGQRTQSRLAESKCRGHNFYIYDRDTWKYQRVSWGKRGENNIWISVNSRYKERYNEQDRNFWPWHECALSWIDVLINMNISVGGWKMLICHSSHSTSLCLSNFISHASRRTRTHTHTRAHTHPPLLPCPLCQCVAVLIKGEFSSGHSDGGRNTIWVTIELRWWCGIISMPRQIALPFPQKHKHLCLLIYSCDWDGGGFYLCMHKVFINLHN